MKDLRAAAVVGRLQLAAGVLVVQRDPATVQVGTDPLHRVLIQDAPRGTMEFLASLTGRDAVEDLAQRTASRYEVPADSWVSLVEALLTSGFLVEPIGRSAMRSDPGMPAAHSLPDRTALAAAYTPRNAAEAMRQRADAVTLIHGSGRVASSVATVLATAGVGHVHVEPHRPLRPSDVAPSSIDRRGPHQPPETGRPAGAAVPRVAGRSRATSRRAGITGAGPRQADREALAAMIRRVSPEARVHAPAGFVPPTVVVLALDGPPDPDTARRLVRDGVPHVAVMSSELRGVIGPFVLPGRTSCLHCHDLHRSDADPGWPKVRLALGGQLRVPSAVLATHLAAITAGEVLRYLDGRIPSSIDATLEILADDWLVRRRTWRPHPACFCETAVQI